tara:strand:+ start:131 stop:706 length:576 start_codon:yes stop_codon:yes gene_type:complete
MKSTLLFTKKIKEFKAFLVLSFFMGLVVTLSNYLVQFPFNLFGLQEILTYGAFSYPIAFLITDSANRIFGKKVARNIVYFGFFVGVLISFFFSLKQIDLISIRIAIGSGVAFLAAQLLDIKIFDILRKQIWYIPPLISSIISSTIDTLLFFSIAFYATEMNWVTLAFGDLCVKILVAISMLLPFRLVIKYF